MPGDEQRGTAWPGESGTELLSATSGACWLEQWNMEVYLGALPSGPKLTVSSTGSPPDSLANGDDLRI